MAWYTDHEDYILSPYLDILSHYFHKPWRNVSLNDRVGIMVKLADMEKGTVLSDGSVNKEVTEGDKIKIDKCCFLCKRNYGTFRCFRSLCKWNVQWRPSWRNSAIKKGDVSSMKPSGLPEGLMGS